MSRTPVFYFSNFTMLIVEGAFIKLLLFYKSVEQVGFKPILSATGLVSEHVEAIYLRVIGESHYVV